MARRNPNDRYFVRRVIRDMTKDNPGSEIANRTFATRLEKVLNDALDSGHDVVEIRIGSYDAIVVSKGVPLS